MRRWMGKPMRMRLWRGKISRDWCFVMRMSPAIRNYFTGKLSFYADETKKNKSISGTVVETAEKQGWDG